MKVATAILLELLVVAMGLLLPLLSRFYLDHFMSRKNGEVVLVLVGWTGGVVVSAFVGELSNLSAFIAYRLVGWTRHRYIDDAVDLPLKNFRERGWGVDSMGNTSQVGNLLSALISFPGMMAGIAVPLGVLFSISPILALLPIVIAAFIALFSRKYAIVRGKKSQASQKHMTLLQGEVEYALSVESMRLLKTDPHMMSWVKGYIHGKISLAMKITWERIVYWWWFPILKQIGAGIPVVFFLVSLAGVGLKVMTPGMVVEVNAYFTMLLSALVGVITFFEGTFENVKQVELVLSRLDNSNSKEDRTSTPDGNAKNAVDVEDLVFTYPGANSAVLKDISFAVMPGETVAIVGRSGSGKTTFLGMMTGELDPGGGSIKVGGKDPRTLRYGVVGLVPQDNIIYPFGTILQNLGGDQNSVADDLIISHVMEKVGMGDYLGRLNELIGELSGGQKQRIAIARVLLRRPYCIAMDEPTSDLDGITEMAAVSEFVKIAKDFGLTLILTTHSPITMGLVDRVLVFNDGMVAGYGTLQELIHNPKCRSIFSPDLVAMMDLREEYDVMKEKYEALKARFGTDTGEEV
jgi:ABC-type bacteriocin/lantibiotic exporter with double-glycine peptidase domain